MKSVAFKMPGPKPADPADAWVQSRDAEREVPAPVEAIPAEPMKRFTIDVPVSLHTRIKTQCAMQGLKMADVLREMLEREFPAKS
jgi:predicted DNA binding CopG/RHH family protein